MVAWKIQFSLSQFSYQTFVERNSQYNRSFNCYGKMTPATKSGVNY